MRKGPWSSGSRFSKDLRYRSLQVHGKLVHILKIMCQMYGYSKVNKKYLRCVAKFISTLLKNNNHYPADVYINRNAVYCYLKRNDKFTVFDIWHEF